MIFSIFSLIFFVFEFFLFFHFCGVFFYFFSFLIFIIFSFFLKNCVCFFLFPFFEIFCFSAHCLVIFQMLRFFDTSASDHSPIRPNPPCDVHVLFTAAELRHFASEHTKSSADAVGLPKRSVSQGVKSLNDTGMMPQFGCLAQSHQAPSSSTLDPTFKVARQPDDLCEASKISASGLSHLTDVAVMSTACRPNPTTSKQFSSHAHARLILARLP